MPTVSKTKAGEGEGVREISSTDWTSCILSIRSAAQPAAADLNASSCSSVTAKSALTLPNLVSICFESSSSYDIACLLLPT